MSADPVAWKVIESGWAVVGRGGSDIGTVEDVTGDPDIDIFNGLAVSGGLFSAAKYVPAERVTAIYEGRVETNLGEDELDALDTYER